MAIRQDVVEGEIGRAEKGKKKWAESACVWQGRICYELEFMKQIRPISLSVCGVSDFSLVI